MVNVESPLLSVRCVIKFSVSVTDFLSFLLFTERWLLANINTAFCIIGKLDAMPNVRLAFKRFGREAKVLSKLMAIKANNNYSTHASGI